MNAFLPRRPRPLGRVGESGRGQRLVRRSRARVQPYFSSIDHARDAELIVAVGASAPLAIVAPPLLLAPLLVLAGVTVARARRDRRRQERSLVVGLADVLDQLALAVGAGLTLPAAFDAVVDWVPPTYQPVLADTQRRLRAGSSLVDAITRLGGDVPPSGRRAIAVLAAAVRDGTPVGSSLVLAADEARRARRRVVETDVRRLPVVLLLPLVVCVLPAFVLLTLVPLVLGSLDGLQLPGS